MRVTSRLIARIGRRGTALLFFAMLDLLYAISLFNPPHEAKLSPTLGFIRGVAPLWVWGTLWAATGAACLIGAFLRVDRWAFTAAAALKTLWGVTFLVGWLVASLDRGWVSAVVWLAMAGWVLVIASWPEPYSTAHLVDLAER